MPKIMVVEDEPDIQQLMTKILKHQGYEVLIADNGMDALVLAATAVPDLILMDISMPVLNGWEATKRIKAQPELSHIPVLALTAFSMAADRERAFEVGCSGYITKPFNRATLLSMIEQHIAVTRPSTPASPSP